MNQIATEVQGLIQTIEYYEAIQRVLEQIGTAGGEELLAHLSETRNGQATLDAVMELQEGFDNDCTNVERLLDMLNAQLQVKEASDAINGEHGDKEFLSAGE